MQHLILFISSMSILAFSAPASADTSQSQEEIQKKEERAAERRKQREEREKKREEMRKKQEASMQEWREKTQKLLSKQTIQEALDGDEEAQLDVAHMP